MSVLGSPKGSPAYPYFFTRIYNCGHPPEGVRVEILEDGRIQHVIFKSSMPTTPGNDTWQTYTLERCRCCAFKIASFASATTGQSENYMSQQPSNLDVATFQGMRRSNITVEKRDGFLGALERYLYQSGDHPKWHDRSNPEDEEDNYTVQFVGRTVKSYERALRLQESAKDIMELQARAQTSPIEANVPDSSWIEQSGPLPGLKGHKQRWSADAAIPSHNNLARETLDLPQTSRSQTAAHEFAPLPLLNRDSRGFFVLPDRAEGADPLPSTRMFRKFSGSLDRSYRSSENIAKKQSAVGRAFNRIKLRRNSGEERKSKGSIGKSASEGSQSQRNSDGMTSNIGSGN